MLYRTLKRMIENAKRQNLSTDDIAMKVDIFFAVGKLTNEEYDELTGMLSTTGA